MAEIRADSRAGIDLEPPPRRGFIPHAFGVSLVVHAIGVALLLLLATRTEERRRAANSFVRVSILPASMPTPEAPMPVIAPCEEPRVTHRHAKQPRFSLAPKVPDAPAPERQPRDAVAPEATSVMGTNAVPTALGNGGSAVSAGGGNSTGGGDGDAPIPADAVAHLPELLSYVQPEYPSLARARGIEGRVLLMVVIDRAGKVEDDMQIVDSIPALDGAAIEAVRGWRFSPGRDEDGELVRVLLKVPVRFTLR